MEVHRGQVGNNMTITCPDWQAATTITDNKKYLCHDNCKKLSIKAEPQKTAQKGRIHLTNTGPNLIVTITNVQKEDSGTYICGVDRWLIDAKSTFELEVTDVDASLKSSSTSKTSTLPTRTSNITDMFKTDQNPSPNLPDVTTTPVLAIALSSIAVFVLAALCLLIFVKHRNRKPRIMKTYTSPTDDSNKVSAVYVNYNEDLKWKQRGPPKVKEKCSATLEISEELYANDAFAKQCQMENKYTPKKKKTKSSMQPPPQIYTNVLPSLKK